MSVRQKNESKDLDRIAWELEKESNRIKSLGRILIIGGLGMTVAFFLFMLDLTAKIFNRIEGMHREILNSTSLKEHSFDDLNSLIFFLAIRTLVFGIVGGFIIFFIFKLGKSCFDQSTRFIKRKHATEFLDYISHKEKELDEQMKAFYIWNLTVESAFTSKSTAQSKAFGPFHRFFSFEADKNDAGPKMSVQADEK
jgi:hypothetical protein